MVVTLTHPGSVTGQIVASNSDSEVRRDSLLLSEPHGNLVLLLVASVQDFLDLQCGFREGILPQEHETKGLLRIQVLLWHGGLTPRDTVKKSSHYFGRGNGIGQLLKEELLEWGSEKSGPINHFAHVGTTLSILVVCRQAKKILPEEL